MKQRDNGDDEGLTRVLLQVGLGEKGVEWWVDSTLKTPELMILSSALDLLHGRINEVLDYSMRGGGHEEQ